MADYVTMKIVLYNDYYRLQPSNLTQILTSGFDLTFGPRVYTVSNQTEQSLENTPLFLHMKICYGSGASLN